MTGLDAHGDAIPPGHGVPWDDRPDYGISGGPCPYCGRIMSGREGAEQGSCNDCYRDSGHESPYMPDVEAERTGTTCAECGRELTADELRRLDADIDFVDHHDHIIRVAR